MTMKKKRYNQEAAHKDSIYTMYWVRQKIFSKAFDGPAIMQVDCPRYNYNNFAAVSSIRLNGYLQECDIESVLSKFQ